ncbi:MAG: MgtC/SapB family protein [Erysipelotrichaceae bacterium]|nr:MgtC/SapB family protein [Erysipelotrichaceae bacterium]
MYEKLTFSIILFRSILALSIGALIGKERGTKNQPAGIRTHSLVCLGANLIMLTNIFAVEHFDTGDPTRMAAQVITGIGFLGAGTILVTDETKVRGLTTAAGIWVAAAIGLAVGIGFYEGAIISAVSVMLIMTAIQYLNNYPYIRIEVLEIFVVTDSINTYNNVLSYCLDNNARIRETKTTFGKPPKQKSYNNINKKVSGHLTIRLSKNTDQLKFLEGISDIPGVMYVQEI